MSNLQSRVFFGVDSGKELSSLPGRVLLITMDIPWEVFRRVYSWEPHHIVWAQEMDLIVIESVESQLPDFDWVVGLGGGVACDLAKFIAWKKQVPLVLVPTIVSVDAPFTPSIAIREHNVVRYIGNIVPQKIFIDYQLIQMAPKELNRAGIADILSIHTALWDWRCSAEYIGEEYDENIAKDAYECLVEVDKNADEIKQVTPKGIQTIVNLYIKEVELCNMFGNARPEEGSEHIVAYHIEYLTKKQFLHGDLVSFGIFCMSRLQENEPEWITGLMERCGATYNPIQIENHVIRQCLLDLKKFKEQNNLFFSVIDVREIDQEFIVRILRELKRA